jgi:hypothetical protein
MWDKKATEDEDVFQLLGEDGLIIVTQLISNMYETGESSKDLLKLQWLP